jgi:hypothetical protein
MAYRELRVIEVHEVLRRFCLGEGLRTAWVSLEARRGVAFLVDYTEGQGGGGHQAAPRMASTDELEEQVGGASIVGQVVDLVEPVSAPDGSGGASI